MKRQFAICSKCAKFSIDEWDLVGTTINRCRCDFDADDTDEEYFFNSNVPEQCCYILENTVIYNETMADL